MIMARSEVRLYVGGGTEYLASSETQRQTDSAIRSGMPKLQVRLSRSTKCGRFLMNASQKTHFRRFSPISDKTQHGFGCSRTPSGVWGGGLTAAAPPGYATDRGQTILQCQRKPYFKTTSETQNRQRSGPPIRAIDIWRSQNAASLTATFKDIPVIFHQFQRKINFKTPSECQNRVIDGTVEPR